MSDATLTTPARLAERRRCFTPPTLAEFLGCTPEKIIRWIRRGELRASNITADPGGRPRYVITPEALEEFLRARQPNPPAPRPRRRRKAEAEVDYLADIS